MSSLASAFNKVVKSLDLVVNSEIKQRPQKRTKGETEEEEGDEDSDDKNASPTTEQPTLRLSRKRQRAEADAKREGDPDRQARTLFIGNVALSVTRPQLTRMLQAFLDADSGITKTNADASSTSTAKGDDIESVRLRSVPIEKVPISNDGSFKHMIKAAVAQKSYLKSSKGDAASAALPAGPIKASMTAYAVFKTAEAASKCLALDGTILEGKHLRVDRIGGENGGKLDYKRTIFVGNLPFTADEDDIRSFFNGLRWGSGDSAGAAVEAVRIVRDRVTHKGKGIAFVLFSDRAHVVTALGLGDKASYKGRALRIERCSADGKAGGAAKKTKMETKVAPRYQGSTGDATAKVSAVKSTKRGEPTKKKFFKRRY